MTVIDDVKDQLEDDWDTSLISLPHICDGATKYIRTARDHHPFGGGKIIYITNPKTIPKFTDPRKEYKDVTYEVNLEMIGNTPDDRDDIFYDAYRIVEVTGISGYENREILEYRTKNDFEKFGAELRFTIKKYNETVAR